MNFPSTQQTLIRRIVTQGCANDWQQFFSDYWLPVCRFARRRAGLSTVDAEDVASETLQAVIGNHLLERWSVSRASKLRTLLCTVVRRVLSNRARVEKGRRELLKDNYNDLMNRDDFPTLNRSEAAELQEDEFERAWIEALLYRAVEAVMGDFHRRGKGDYFRVLYGKVCERLSVPEISDALGISRTNVENYFKAARKRLEDEIRHSLRQHVVRYCDPQDVAEEFASEWKSIGSYLSEKGGLDEVVAELYAQKESVESIEHTNRAMEASLEQLTQQMRAID